MAQGVFEHLMATLPPAYPPVKADSAGTGAYHIDDTPDQRTLATLEVHGIHGFDHLARQFHKSDFDNFDYILAMDQDNLKDLQGVRQRLKSVKRPEPKISLFGDYSARGSDARDSSKLIQDPYYGGDYGFEIAFQQCVEFSQGWLRDVLGIDIEMDNEGNVALKVPKGSADNVA